MSYIDFQCPHCQGQMRAGSEHAGTTQTCPECRGPLIIPAAAPPVPEAAPMPRRRRRPHSSSSGPARPSGCGHMLRIAVWVVCLSWSLKVALLYWARWASANSAVAQAAAAADAAADLLIAYVAARAIDKLVSLGQAPRRRRRGQRQAVS